ncbi:rRNA adenine N(6)-methyltransferase family protein [Lachnospiraceae bacterium 54-53]
MSKTKKVNLNYTRKLTISQNFITSSKLLHRIVNLSTISKKDTVLEIGSGKGHLTNVLCEKCGYLYSIEIDKQLFDKTKEKLSAIKNLQLIYGDFLKYRLPFEGKYKVFANIPYSITTQIAEKLTEAENPPNDIWLVVEKGVAKRFMGIPAETKKSLFLKINWNMKIVYYFKRGDFHPEPSVDSVLLHLSRKECSDLDRTDFISFKKFVEHSLKFGLFSNKSLLTKKQVSTALKQADLPQLKNDGVTLYIQWLCLFRCYKRFNRR